MLSYIEISKENLIHNFQTFRNFIHPGAKIAAVIKANAYGHGQNEIAKILEKHVDYFQVDDASEFLLLRKITEKPVLILGYVSSDELAEVLEKQGILAVYDAEQAQIIDDAAKKLGTKATVHVKIDACLGRQGVLISELENFVVALKKCENVKVEGIYSHFANIEDTNDFSHAQLQIENFQKAKKYFQQEGYENLLSHIAASSGIMVYEKNDGKSDIVRPGIGLYGMWPSDDLKAKLNSSEFNLRPVMRWVSHIAQVKTVPKNYTIGYGLTYVTDKPTKIAIIPQGYSDGYDRGLSNCGEVLIKGTRCKVLGRVAMNMFVVNVDHLENVKAEDEVVLLGKQGQQCIIAEEIAEKIGTINYEITTRISPLLPRIII